MSGAADTFSPRPVTGDPGAPSGRLGPAEGWSSVLLLALMCTLVGWAIDDAHWVLGPPSNTDFLSWAGLLGFAWGAAAGILHRGRFIGVLGGAIVAAFALSVMIGAQLDPGGSPGELFQTTSNSLVGAYLDLVVHHRMTTTQVGHFLLVLGALTWGTGQFAGYAAYRHHRPLTAVVVPGAVLLANVGLTRLNQFPVLVVYTLAALFFLLRFHIADEERAWHRHRIADVGDAVSLSLRAGAAFIVVAFSGALLLTQSTSSAPLAGAWSGVNQQLYDLGNTIARLFPAGGPGTRIGGPGFGSTVTVTGSWVTDDSPVLTITTPRRDWTPVKWRAAAYDRMSATTWSISGVKETSVAAGSPPLAGTEDAPVDGVAYTTESYTVDGPSGAPGIVVSPGISVSVDRTARPRLVTSGDLAYWSSIAVTGGGQYHAKADLPDLSNPADPTTLTSNRLRTAGQDYAPELKAVYTLVDPASVGPETRALAQSIIAKAGATNPYDIARAIEDYLRDPKNFTYDTDVTDIDCGSASVVECFVIHRHGYCEHYASTMTLMLRLQGIPARFVEGYLPGDRNASGVETIKRNRAHAWVEVWFPDAGWVDFDPTGGGVGSPTRLPAGAAAASPTPAGSGGAAESRRPARGDGLDTNPGAAGSATRGVSPLLWIMLGIIGLLAVLGLLAAVLYRRMGRPAAPEVVYRTVVSMASRLGHPRAPTQTVYEYIGALSDALPSVTPELELVGRSAVETVYGRKRLAGERLTALGSAQRRLRVALLRLAFIRKGRKRRRRP
jgi:transglutaminase-like putative cysteine protease